MVNQPINGKNDEGSIQAGESSTRSQGSDKATSLSSYKCKRTMKFLETGLIINFFFQEPAGD